MLDSVRKTFGVGGRPLTWKALIGGEVSNLFGSGGLLQSLEMTSGIDFAEVSTDLPHAKWMQWGSHPLVTERSKKFFWMKYIQTGQDFWKGMALKHVGTRLNIPPRPFMLFQEEDIETIKSFFGEGLVKFITADQEIIG